jgi:hypothetical protein
MRFDWARTAPSSWLLVATNALLLAVLLLRDCQSAMCVVLFGFAFMVLESMSLAYQGLLQYFSNKLTWNPIAKILSFHVPLILVFIWTLLPSDERQRENQRSPATSPNGAYILEVPIEQRVWTVKIFDQRHRLLYVDQDSEFLGRFNSYWHWDKNNRVWLYNSDNGEIVFWEVLAGEWRKQRWDRTQGSGASLKPPPEMYPDYALPKK